MHPLVAVYVTSVWSAGANPTRFVLFDDGEALFTVDHGSSYRWCQLSQRELALFTASVDGREFFNLDNRYNLFPGASDLPTTHVLLSMGGQGKKVAVRGVEPFESLAKIKRFVPAPFERVLDAVGSIRTHESREWLPEAISVGLREASPWGRKQQAVSWPDDWPGFESSAAVQPTAGVQGHITLPGKYWPEARDLEKKARFVRINGAPYFFYLSLCIPGQQMWLGTQ